MSHHVLGTVVDLTPDPKFGPDNPGWQGGTVTFKVVHEGTWIGWVGDGRSFNGSRYGARKWWACWRQEGDTAARWCSDLEYTSKKRALVALMRRLAEGSERSDPKE